MTLPRKLAATFTPLLRSKGDDAYRNGRVYIDSTTASLVIARVHGSDWYQVQIRVVKGGALDMQCTCPYARDHGNCKHIWGVLVACDQAGTLPTEPDVAYLEEGRSMREAEEAAELERRTREASAREAADRVRAEAMLAMQPPPRASIAAPIIDPRPWVQQLRAIRTLMRPAHEARREMDAFPFGKRIVYIIDAARSALREHGLVVDVGIEAPLKKPGMWGI